MIFFVFLGFIFLCYGEFVDNIKMKLRVQAIRAALASGARGALPLVGGASFQCRGVTAGNANHNASSARGVTAGKMGRNSSYSNRELIVRSQLGNGPFAGFRM